MQGVAGQANAVLVTLIDTLGNAYQGSGPTELEGVISVLPTAAGPSAALGTEAQILNVSHLQVSC